MKWWIVIDKRAVSDPRGGVSLVVVCERNGSKREAVVSGETWDRAAIGSEIKLVDLR